MWTWWRFPWKVACMLRKRCTAPALPHISGWHHKAGKGRKQRCKGIGTQCMHASAATCTEPSLLIDRSSKAGAPAAWRSSVSSLHSHAGNICLSSHTAFSLRAVLLTPLDASPLDHAHSLADVCKLVRRLHQIYCWKDLFKGFHYHTSLPALMTYTKRYAEMGL